LYRLVTDTSYISRLWQSILTKFTACLLVLAEIISSTLKMEAICSSETSVATQQTTRHHIPEDDTLHSHCCENLKSYKVYSTFNHYCLTPIFVFQAINHKFHIVFLVFSAILSQKVTFPYPFSVWGFTDIKVTNDSPSSECSVSVLYLLPIPPAFDAWEYDTLLLPKM
jgi:hypothetical protein